MIATAVRAQKGAMGKTLRYHQEAKKSCVQLLSNVDRQQASGEKLGHEQLEHVTGLRGLLAPTPNTRQSLGESARIQW